MHPLHDAGQDGPVRRRRRELPADLGIGRLLALRFQLPLVGRGVAGGELVAQHREDGGGAGHRHQDRDQQADMQAGQHPAHGVDDGHHAQPGGERDGPAQPVRPDRERHRGRREHRVQAGPQPPGQVGEFPGPLEGAAQRGHLGPLRPSRLASQTANSTRLAPSSSENAMSAAARTASRPESFMARQAWKLTQAARGNSSPADGWAVSTSRWASVSSAVPVGGGGDRVLQAPPPPSARPLPGRLSPRVTHRTQPPHPATVTAGRIAAPSPARAGPATATSSTAAARRRRRPPGGCAVRTARRPRPSTAPRRRPAAAAGARTRSRASRPPRR